VNSFSLFHIIRKSEGTSPAPVLVLLHGVRSNEEDLMGLAPAIDPRFMIVSTRAPLTLGPAAYGWFHVQFTPDGFSIDPTEAENSRQLLLRFVDELARSYNVDPERIYLLGFSQGAIMSLYAALTEPKKFAGIVTMSGRLLPDAMQKRAGDKDLEGLPILAVHGVGDEVIPIHYGRSIKEQLSSLPLDLTYREYPIGHWVSDQSLRDVTTWLSERLDRPAFPSAAVSP
jgi:phospholipase/carboxylesterase